MATTTTTSHRPLPKPLDLELTIISAKHLKNINWRNGHLHPYVIFWLDPDRRLATKPDDSNSTKPVWNERFLIPIPSSPSTTFLTLEIFHSKPSDSPKPLVGTLKLPIHDFLNPNPSLNDSTVVRTFDLRRPSGRPHGKIKLKFAIRERHMPDYQIASQPYYYNTAIPPSYGKVPPSPSPYITAPPPYSTAPPPYSTAPPPYNTAPPPYNTAPLPYSTAPPPPVDASPSPPSPPPPPPPPPRNVVSPPLPPNVVSQPPPRPYHYGSNSAPYSGYYQGGYYPQPQPRQSGYGDGGGVGGIGGPSAPVGYGQYEQKEKTGKVISGAGLGLGTERGVGVVAGIGGPSAPVDYAQYEQKEKTGKVATGAGLGLGVGAVVGGVAGLAVDDGLRYRDEKVGERVEGDVNARELDDYRGYRRVDY